MCTGVCFEGGNIKGLNTQIAANSFAYLSVFPNSTRLARIPSLSALLPDLRHNTICRIMQVSNGDRPNLDGLNAVFGIMSYLTEVLTVQGGFKCIAL